ncbi:hypothetical protein [uncultured Corynebacterium sp.]|uniref:hypothetical protein n=1 Tax=uncultured Corynebacterium sp. TaxID=159447 RepID=UPI0025E2FEB1|nr:hypothetical protein [uncultured Corynebacterium sp.]
MQTPAKRQKFGEREQFSLRISPELQRASRDKARRLGVTKSAYLAELIARDTGVPGHELPVQPSQRTKT